MVSAGLVPFRHFAERLSLATSWFPVFADSPWRSLTCGFITLLSAFIFIRVAFSSRLGVSSHGHLPSVPLVPYYKGTGHIGLRKGPSYSSMTSSLTTLAMALFPNKVTF